ncbi:MAG TPA: hemerythrin domain-containing protein [Polyangiales bacterium]|jgi:hemerythrin superfamily protein
MAKPTNPKSAMSAMDKIMSKGMGAAKAAKAAMSGLVGVFSTLAKQHGEVSALLERVKRNADKRADLWPTIKMELLSHEQGEMRVVYPVLREHVETRELADHHDREASELRETISRIDALALEDPMWAAQFDQLVDLVKHHVHDEESEIFPKAQKAIGDDRARELEPLFLQAKQQAAHAA